MAYPGGELDCNDFHMFLWRPINFVGHCALEGGLCTHCVPDRGKSHHLRCLTIVDVLGGNGSRYASQYLWLSIS